MDQKTATLRQLCDDALAGFLTNENKKPMTYNRQPMYATFQSPIEIFKASSSLHYMSYEKVPHWEALPKEGPDDCYKALKQKKNHVVPDPDWVPPIKHRPIYPPTRGGVKLRDVETILQESEKLSSMSDSQRCAYTQAKREASGSGSGSGPAPTSSTVKSAQAQPKVKDPVQDILNDIAAASARPRSSKVPASGSQAKAAKEKEKGKDKATPFKRPVAPTSSLPSSAQHSETLSMSQQRVDSSSSSAPPSSASSLKQPQRALQARSPTTKKKGAIILPDLFFLKKYLPLSADDPIATRKISDLGIGTTTPEDCQVRPVLNLHLPFAAPPAAKKPSPKRKLSREDEQVQKSAKKQKVTSGGVAVASSSKRDPPPKSPKRELSRGEDSAEREPKKQKVSPGGVAASSSSKAAGFTMPHGTIPAEFIRSMRIPKRKTSAPKKQPAEEPELEEGEMVSSPSPSPEHRSPSRPFRRSPSPSSRRPSRRSPSPPPRRPSLRRSPSPSPRRPSRRSPSPPPVRRPSVRRSPSPSPRRPSVRHSPPSRHRRSRSPPSSSSRPAHPSPSPRESALPSSSSAGVPPPAPSSTASAPSSTAMTKTSSDDHLQMRMFSLMFSNLAKTYKHRGDSAGSDMLSILNHMHALLNYVLAFYYTDKRGQEFNWRNWGSMRGLMDFTLGRLQKLQEHKELYGLLLRISSLIKFYMFSRQEGQVKRKLGSLTGEQQQQQQAASDVVANAQYCLEALGNYEAAYGALREAEKFLGYEHIQQKFPETFKNVCMKGDLSAGIVLGDEAGDVCGPMFPFAPFSRLHHAAIMAKCILAEFVAQNGIDFTPITNTDDYM